MKTRSFIAILSLVLLGVGCKKAPVPVTQEDYQLKVIPTTLTFPAEGGTLKLTILATKTISTIEEGMVKDTKIEDAPFSFTLEGDGFKYADKAVTASKNELPAVRSGKATISIDGTNVKETVSLTQSGLGEVKVTYSLNVTPESYAFPMTGGEMTFTVEAKKTTAIISNEVILDTKDEDAPYEVTIEGEGFTINGNTVTASENKGASRNGTVTVKLKDEELTKTIALTQGASGFPAESYTLDGTKLTKWLGKETTIDLTTDPIFNNVTEIVNGAFNGTLVESLTISDNITKIGDQSFSSADNLKEFKVSAGNKTFYAIDGVLFSNIDNEVNGAPGKSLWRFPKGKDAKDYVIPTGTTNLWQYSFAYTSVSTLIVPEGVLSLNYRAFYQTSSMASIKLPASLTNIGSWCFNGSACTEVHLKRPNPPILGKSVFSNAANITLYVPVGASGNFSGKAPWNGFKQIVEE